MSPELARLGIARLTRRPRGWLPAAGWGAFALLAALVAREKGGTAAVDLLLLGPFASLALPFLVLGIVAAVCGRENLRTAVRPLVAFGATPWRAAMVSITLAALASAVVAAVLGMVVTLVSHRAGGPPLVSDVLTTAWVAALGGVAYAAYFAFGSCFGARGGGRGVLLVLDFFLGSGMGAGAVLTPHGHVRNLLGGPPPIDLSQHASAWFLIGLIAVYGSLALVRARR